MPAPSQLLRAARPAFRNSSFFTSRAQAQTQAFRFAGFRSRFANAGRRWQSTEAGASTGATAGGATAQIQQSWFKRMWDSPIGLKTVHFWAPVMKWAIVLAGISDFYRPAEKLSLTQNFALTCTGIIWTRWCLIIKPRNILLAAVNFFLGCVGVIQVSRILMYRSSVKGQTAGEQLQDAKEGAVDAAKGLKKDVERAVGA